MGLSEKQYWDEVWSNRLLPEAINPHKQNVSNFINVAFHKYFTQIFSNLHNEGTKLLEIGCAGSPWLPYFAREFGFNVAGLDYSEIGCNQARAILEKEKVEGEIIQADFFSPPESMLEFYDVLVSFGVVEHFENTTDCLIPFLRFLKPGGIIITVIPNIVGFLGIIQKIINKPVYDIHELIDRELLYNAHIRAGFNVIKCHYFLSVNFGVLNLNGLKEKTFSWYSKKLLIAVLNRLSMFIWLLEKKGKIISPTKYFSPYIICFGQKPFDKIGDDKCYERG